LTKKKRETERDEILMQVRICLAKNLHTGSVGVKMQLTIQETIRKLHEVH
jgi:hypothetical protein